MQDRRDAYMPYLAAFLIFMSSRVVMLLAIVFSHSFIPQNSGGEYWNLGLSWYRYLLRYDSGWYWKIASEGYTYNGDDLVQQSVVFYPLYPLVSWTVSVLFDVHPTIALLIVSNSAILIAVLLIFKLIKDDYGEGVALFALSSLSFFPTSFFFSVAYTESLAFLLISAFFLLLKKEQYFFTASCAGLTLATRPTGIVLLLPLLWELWRKFLKERKRLIIYVLGCGILATSGLWSYMIYLWAAFDSPLAFMTAQRAWHNGNEIGSNFFSILTLRPFRHLTDILKTGPQTYTLDIWFFLSFLLIILLFRRKLTISYNIFAFGVLLLPYLTRSGSLGFVSVTRYLLLAFPVFIILGDLFEKHRWLGICVTAIFAAMVFMYTALFAQWYWVG
jgi:Gpi18-like mannosyltransferase